MGQGDCGLRDAIRLDPTAAYVYCRRGHAYKAKKDVDKAIADYSEAIRLQPDCVEAYLGRASQYYAKKDYRRTQLDCRKVLKLEPKNNEAGNLLRTTTLAYGPLWHDDE